MLHQSKEKPHHSTHSVELDQNHQFIHVLVKLPVDKSRNPEHGILSVVCKSAQLLVNHCHALKILAHSTFDGT